jgi:hypothetical protein
MGLLILVVVERFARDVRSEDDIHGVQGTRPLPAGGISFPRYLGVMPFLVLAVGMAVAGSSGQGCLG